MSKAFDTCRANGGKVRTLSLKGGKYMHVCILNGNSYRGEVKTSKSKSEETSVTAAAIQHSMRGKK